MRGFKVGDKVVIIELLDNYPGNLKVGDIATIGEVSKRAQTVKMVCDAEISCTWQFEFNIKHAEKWSIYNNTLPWSELSDKQKGELLLAAHSNLTISVGNIGLIFKPAFDDRNMVYQVKKPEPIKPEPTMAELFNSDSVDFDFRRSTDFPEYMISKGWTKTCK
jgi:hypothetical protein